MTTPGAPAPASPKPLGAIATRLQLASRRLGLLVFAFLVAFVPLECAVRTLLPAVDPPLKKSFLVDTRRDRTPYTMFGKPPYNGPTPGEKEAGEYRVVMLGGSTVEHGNPAIAGLLEEQLRAGPKPTARVFNYGVVASNSGQALARLVFDVSDLKPDLVVLYDGANDLINPWIGDPRPGYPFDFLLWERNPVLIEALDDYPTFSLLLYGSAVARRIAPGYFASAFSGVDDLRARTGHGTAPWIDELPRRYVANHVKAARVTKAFGAEYIGFFQPLVYFREPRTAAEERMIDRSAEGVEVGRTAVRKLFSEATQRGDVREGQLVDLSDAFDGIEEEVFWNSMHHHQKFRPIIATRIRESLEHLWAAPAADPTPAPPTPAPPAPAPTPTP